MRRPEYCTQAARTCKECSLVNYGLDCRNNPLSTVAAPKRLRGWDAAMAEYRGHNGPVTIEAVIAQIPQALRDRLTGRELGMVMSAVNAAYHNGRASHGGLDLCDDAVWLPWGGKEGKGQLVPVAALSKITQEEVSAVK